MILCRMSVTGERILISMFPDIDWEIWLKIEYVSFFAMIPLMMLFYEKQFPREFSKRVLYVSLVTGSLFSVFTLLTPARINSYTIPLYQIASMAFCMYMCYMAALTIIRRRLGSVLLVSGGLVFFITLINDILIANEIYSFIALTPYGLFILVSCQSILISKKFSNAFATVEAQARQLEINTIELREKNIALENSNRIKDMFLANTSHELRTPLHGMIGLSEAMIEGAAGPLSRLALENLTLIASSGHKLARMVNDLLDMAKIQDEGLDLDLRPLKLHFLCNMVVRLLRPLVGEKPVTIINSITEELPAVHADEDRIRQVLQNLVGNAVKFTNSGQIEISARLADMPPSGKTPEHTLSVIVTVSDTGIGVPDEYREKIFEAYQQVDGSDTRTYQGSGLGLSIAQRIVELHGGRIWLESWRQGGSAFSFTLPVSTVQELDPDISTVAEEAPVSAVDPGQLHKAAGQDTDAVFESRPVILVVDDDPVNLMVVRNCFEPKKCTVITATDGAAALEIVDTHGHLDLVLLDIMMTVMSGYDVCRKIRKKLTTAQLPVIMLTAKNMMSDIDAAFAAGANDYLVKPMRMSELVARVGTMLTLRTVTRTTAKSITVPTRNGSFLLSFSDMIYITSHAKNIVIHTTGGDIELPVMMKDIIDRLPPDLFVRIHKSHLIHMKFLHSVSHIQSGRYCVHLNDEDDTTLPVGRVFLETLRKKIRQ